MNVLITGSRGYIGSTLAKTFVRNYTVPLGVDRELRPNGPSIYGLFHHTDFEDPELADIVVKSDIDTICHLAADASVPDSLSSPGKYYHNNVGATVQLLNNLVKEGWKGNFIFSSSAAVYPSTPHPVTENEPTQPMNPYGHSKLMGEQILYDFHNAYNINVVCFRYFNVAGAWDDVGDHESSDHVLQKLVKSIHNQSEFTIYGSNKNTPDGTCVRDYLHVRDVCDAHLKAIEHLKANPGFYIYNLGTSVGTSVKQLVKQFTTLSGKDLDVCLGEDRPGDPDLLVADGQKFVSETGYTYKHSDLKKIINSALSYSERKKG